MNAEDRERKRALRAEAKQKAQLSIAWNGHPVGWIDGWRYDFPHYYGRWVSSGDRIAQDFLAELRRAVERDEGLDVTLGDDSRGTVHVHPDDQEGEIDVRSDLR